jgi:hypothetical protein
MTSLSCEPHNNIIHQPHRRAKRGPVPRQVRGIHRVQQLRQFGAQRRAAPHRHVGGALNQGQPQRAQARVIPVDHPSQDLAQRTDRCHRLRRRLQGGDGPLIAGLGRCPIQRRARIEQI